ncbi:MAG TPA: alpha/beta hydrolase-fold protein [Verrucomicrobiae bacterium]|nr:alpha/beta hydrolase-fold protein [Verrucomicrobiae bacterium]
MRSLSSRYLHLLLPLLFSVPHLSESQEAGDGQLRSPRISALKNELGHGNRSALERFWIEADGNAPLIEKFANDDGLLLVTFLWRGGSEVSSVLLQGGPPTPAQKLLVRLADTDLWFRTDPIPQDARFTYGFEVRTNQNIATGVEAVPDKLNHHSFDWRSFVELPTAPPQPWIERLPDVPQGRITVSKIQSKCLSAEREIGIYTPADYSPHVRPCNILIVFDGQAYREVMPLPVILDNLIAKAQIPPTIAIGIPNPSHEIRQRDLHCYDPFADFIAKELIPWARKNYNISSDPHRAVVAGSSAGGLTAAFCAFRYPKVFGNVLSQSGSFWYAPGQRDSLPDYLQERGWLTRQFVSTQRLPIHFFIETGRFEFQAQVFDHHRIRDVLEAKGYPVIYREYNGGHDYFNWRGTFGDGLISLFGKGNG